MKGVQYCLKLDVKVIKQAKKSLENVARVLKKVYWWYGWMCKSIKRIHLPNTKS